MTPEQKTEKQFEAAILASDISITMTVAEMNNLLTIIGKCPFEEVYEIVAKIQKLGQPQVDAIVAKVRNAI